MYKNSKNTPGISRRNVLQQLTLTGAGIALFGTSSANNIFNGAGNQGPLLPFSIPPMPPLQPGPGGLDIRTRVRSSQTNGQFSCVETAVAPMHMGPAPHVHKDLDELMYVLEGTATVLMNGTPETIAAGGWHFRPRKIEHTFWNASDEPLRFIDMYFNQNFEDFLEELFHKIFPDMQKSHLTPADPDIARRIAALNARFGVTTFNEKRQPLVEKYRLKA